MAFADYHIMEQEIQLYYLVPEDQYSECEKSKNQNDYSLLDEYPERVARKAEKVLLYLQKQGTRWNKHGLSQTDVPEMMTSFNLVQYVIYSVAPSGKVPLDYDSFLNYIFRIKAPMNVFSKRIQKKLIRIENKQKRNEEKEEQNTVD